MYTEEGKNYENTIKNVWRENPSTAALKESFISYNQWADKVDL